MSDISIPGINSRFNTDSIIQGLVDAESIRLQRLEGDRAEFQNERLIWQDLNRGITQLRNESRDLFSFENPFNERNAISENDRVLRAEATREAQEGSTFLKVFQTASADRFLSQELDSDYKIPEGVYGFTVGDESIRLQFRGGTLREFSNALNKRNPDILRSSVVQNRPGSEVILIESLKEGADNPLGFEGDAQRLALELGLAEQVESYTFESDELYLAPRSRARIPLDKPAESTEGLILEYEVSLSNLTDDSQIQGEPIPADPGLVSFQGITLPNIPSEFPPIPEDDQPRPIETNSVLFAIQNNQAISLPDVEPRNPGTFVKVELDISDISSRLDALELRNDNSNRELRIRNLALVDPKAKGNFRPLNPVSQAQNALLELDGIQVERDSNTIDDLVPGTSLELRGVSDETVELRIEPDRELVKETIIEWVAAYNQIIRDANIYTRRDPAIIDEIEYFSDEERNLYTERLGIFQGDSALNTLRQRLQTITTNSYQLNPNASISLLSQIGISTNASRGSTGFNPSQLRGYLEINEATLDRALNDNFFDIKDLFGMDSDGDLVIDQGIGFQVDNVLRSYTEAGGIISARTSRYDSLISRSNEDIEDYQEHLEQYEANLRREFGVMESTINNLERATQGIENLNPSNRNN